MVSHQSADIINMRTSRGLTSTAAAAAKNSSNAKDADISVSVYHSSPIPSMPRLTTTATTAAAAAASTTHHHHHHHNPYNHHNRQAADSMLAYTERMREIAKFRSSDPGGGAGELGLGGDPPPPNTVLEVQARHIPRAGGGMVGGAAAAAAAAAAGRHRRQTHPQRQTLNKQRRPLSLDEHLRPEGKKDSGDPRDAGRAKPRERCMSEPSYGRKQPSATTPSLPALALASQRSGGGKAEEEPKDKQRIRISFVSAADLFDLVDFSLRSKRSRAESIRLARAEDTLRLLSEAHLLRSLAAARRAKAGTAEEKSERADLASLVVQGTASPRDSWERRGERKGKAAGEKEEAEDEEGDEDDAEEGGWARREIRRNTANNTANSNANSNANAYDSDDEGDDDDEDDLGDPFQNLDLAHNQKLLMLLQPHKLRFRPKRAKRMRLHRSLLSAIPEDERQRRESLNSRTGPPTPSSNRLGLPVVPSSSSLAAIKSSKKLNEVDAEPTIPTASVEGRHARKQLAEDIPTLSYSRPHNDQTPPRDTPCMQSDDSPLLVDGQLLPSELAQKKCHSAREEQEERSPRRHEAARRTTPGTKAGPQASAVSPDSTAARFKAHKKFKKLIFLRDQPEQTYPRFS